MATTLDGTLLDKRYRLEEKVGSGGMSTVYRATDLTLERTVAVKLLHREIATDSDQLERFRREARSVARLSHPNIVTVIDASEDDGRPFIVFEYVDGETLKQKIQRLGKLPIAESVAHTIEIARALECAHDHQMVHRDIKPHNVLIDPEGTAKVTDFGIAQTLDQEGLTETGRVIGTTDYVAPEQALGHAVTGQSDIYSLGIVLFEMLTGRPPFQGDNQVAVAMMHVRDAPPDIRSLRPEVSAALASAVDKATAKDAAHRYTNVEEMIDDLGAVLGLESARSSKTSTEVTSVLKTIPDVAAPRPLFQRHPAWSLALALSIVGVAVGFGILLAGNAHRGTGGSGETPKAPGLKAVSLSQTAAHDFDPAGGDGEHPEQVNFVVDRDPATTWVTERYDGGVFNKPGVGIYLDASPGVAAKVLDLKTPTPGFHATVYGALGDAPKSAPPGNGWIQLSGDVAVKRETRFSLDTANKQFRNYLVWITTVPPDGKAQISELELLK